MPNTTTPTRPKRAAARVASVKLEHRAAKELARRGRRAERRIARASESAADVQRAILAAAPPELVPAARLVADIVWNKFAGETFADFLRSACEEGSEDVSATTFFFQHRDMAGAAGITGLVEEAQDAFDDDLGEFPESFKSAIDAINGASGWTMGSIDTFCGGLQTCDTKAEMPAADEVTVDVRLDGSSTVVVPFDPERFGDLYSAAVPGQLVKSARKQ